MGFAFSGGLIAVRLGLLALLLILLTGEMPLSPALCVPLEGLLLTETVLDTLLILTEGSDTLLSSSSQLSSVLCPFLLY
jgi:hypothetical protein